MPTYYLFIFFAKNCMKMREGGSVIHRYSGTQAVKFFNGATDTCFELLVTSPLDILYHYP